MKNNKLKFEFIAILLPMVVLGQSTSSSSVKIGLAEFHQLAVPKLEDQVVLLHIVTDTKKELVTDESPVVLSSTDNFNFFARSASQDFSSLNFHQQNINTLLSITVNETESKNKEIDFSQNTHKLNVGGVKNVSGKDLLSFVKNNPLILASQSVIGYGKPTIGKALQFRYVVNSQKAFEFFKENNFTGKNNSVIYTITSN
ncbi:MAG: hypothetical protein JST62_00090 [Bacteroidetes bacterium]|nr:hypothetical protein [Bacteroidota bacterium]